MSTTEDFSVVEEKSVVVIDALSGGEVKGDVSELSKFEPNYYFDAVSADEAPSNGGGGGGGHGGTSIEEVDGDVSKKTTAVEAPSTVPMRSKAPEAVKSHASVSGPEGHFDAVDAMDAGVATVDSDGREDEGAPPKGLGFMSVAVMDTSPIYVPGLKHALGPLFPVMIGDRFPKSNVRGIKPTRSSLYHFCETGTTDVFVMSCHAGKDGLLVRAEDGVSAGDIVTLDDLAKLRRHGDPIPVVVCAFCNSRDIGTMLVSQGIASSVWVCDAKMFDGVTYKFLPQVLERIATNDTRDVVLKKATTEHVSLVTQPPAFRRYSSGFVPTPSGRDITVADDEKCAILVRRKSRHQMAVISSAGRTRLSDFNKTKKTVTDPDDEVVGPPPKLVRRVSARGTAVDNVDKMLRRKAFLKTKDDQFPVLAHWLMEKFKHGTPAGIASLNVIEHEHAARDIPEFLLWMATADPRDPGMQWHEAQRIMFREYARVCMHPGDGVLLLRGVSDSLFKTASLLRHLKALQTRSKATLYVLVTTV